MPEIIEAALHSIIVLFVHLLEIMGVIVILFGAVRDFIWYFTGREVNIRLDLARSLALGLEFKLGGEMHHAADLNQIGNIRVSHPRFP